MSAPRMTLMTSPIGASRPEGNEDGRQPIIRASLYFRFRETLSPPDDLDHLCRKGIRRMALRASPALWLVPLRPDPTAPPARAPSPVRRRCIVGPGGRALELRQPVAARATHSGWPRRSRSITVRISGLDGLPSSSQPPRCLGLARTIVVGAA